MDWIRTRPKRMTKSNAPQNVFAYDAQREKKARIDPSILAFSEAQICQQCRSSFLTFDREGDRGWKTLHETFTSFAVAAEQNCQICEELWKKLSHEQRDDLATKWKGEPILSMIQGTHVSTGQSTYAITIQTTGRLREDRRSISQTLLLEPISENLHCFLDYEIRPSTSAKASLDLCRSWYTECAKQHHRCKDVRPPSYRGPSRLIEISPGQAFDWRLYLVPRGEARKLQYVALSHCWGHASFLNLTQATMKSMLSGMSMSSLPKTFRDAAYVARSLGFKYLWIDSLCILQDSIQDWRQEASHMQEVYRHSSCTIAATAASDSDRGCFVERDPCSVKPAKITIRWPDKADENEYLLLNEEYVKQQLTRAPLNQRAWVIQERVLSPRILHFGQYQVFWECSETLTCEAFPRELPWAFMGNSDEHLSRYCTSFLSGIDSSNPKETLHERRQRIHSMWPRLVDMYTRCALTRSDDKLVALSGLAKQFNEALINDDYLAGLWRGNLLHNLLWCVPEGKQGNGLDSSRPSIYRAPSWSWASVDAMVSADPWNSTYADTMLVDCLHARTQSITDDSTGQVCNGVIRLYGRLIQACFDEGLRELRTSSKLFKADVIFDCPSVTRTADTHFFLPVRMYVEDRQDEHESVQGLILQRRPEGGAEGDTTYVRIGYWEANTLHNEERVRGINFIPPGKLNTIWQDAPLETFVIV